MISTLSVKMPKGKKCAACLSFDFDAISLWMGAFRQSSPTAVSRGEFGDVAAQRILDLLDKYSIKTTWCIPGHTIETYPDTVKEIFANGHEIGHHNYLHETPLGLNLEQERKIMKRGIDCIKEITGERPLGYRSPAWDLSPNTIGILLEERFIYDSSMMAHDYLPYKVRSGDVPSQDGAYKFGNDTNLIELPVSWSLDDFPHFEFLLSNPGSGLKAGSAVLENWVNDFDYMYENISGGVFNIVFHPQIIGRGHRMIVLEKLIQHIMNKEDVWFTRMIDVAKACDLESQRQSRERHVKVPAITR
jgi:peptidoglycan/xylan/chitin deacetylase (PgdA/CDA1 family)